MSKILLDYVFPISVITPTPAASTAFLKQACLVVKPKAGQEGAVGSITECSTMVQVAALTDNTNAQQLFNAGMTKVFVLLADDLDLESPLTANAGEFFTLLVSDDFDDDDVTIAAASLVQGDLTFQATSTGPGGNLISVEFLDSTTAGNEVVTVTSKKISVAMETGVSTATQLKTALDNSEAASALITTEIATGQDAVAQAAFAEDFLENGSGLFAGSFEGVTGVASNDKGFIATQAVIENRVGFYSTALNGANNLCYAFGKLLSNLLNWTNQQFITMPLADDVSTLGDANSLFDDKVSFVINDDEFGTRLGLFAAGGKAVAAPYILKNLRIDIQSKALQWISANQPNYTLTEATLLENRINEDVLKLYIENRKWIADGTIEIKLEQDNFVASGYINVAEPKALWRVLGEMRQTL